MRAEAQAKAKGTARVAAQGAGAGAGRRITIAKIGVWALALAPLAWLVLRALQDRLGANPIEEITEETGRWALILLLATLAVTPLRRLGGWNVLIRFRRLLGLFAFFYAVLHFLTYVVVDHFFAFGDMIEDVLERPYITVGFTAFVLLIPLALTSTKRAVRRLRRRWSTLHRAIYVCGALAVLHYLWSVKLDTRDPIWFAVVLVVLLALRLPVLNRQRARKTRQASATDVQRAA